MHIALFAAAFMAVFALESGVFTSTQFRVVSRLPPPGSTVPIAGYSVSNVFPHDRQAFTQGLEYRDGFLFESTGLTGRSTVRKVELRTGRILQQVSLAREHFGEGLTLWGSTILQLTWQTNIGVVYDRDTFRRLRTFAYAGEGWGLTHSPSQIVMSDGTAFLRFLDPTSLKEIKRIRVIDAGFPIERLNELEWINGEIYANVWQTDLIVRISPDTGRVLRWVNLAGLLPESERRRGADVLNGIAYDTDGRRLFVTGKLWPSVFEIMLQQSR
jgi:glutamine cyclotransferase